MKAFRFPLQAVLTIRLNEERKALEAFALAQAEHERLKLRRGQIEQEMADLFAARNSSLQTRATSDTLRQMQLGLRALQDSLRKCDSELQWSQTVLDEKSRFLFQARQKREAIEKLRDKQMAQHQRDFAREEQKLLDEFTTFKSSGGFGLKWQ